jgi:hypothetical protein
VNFKKQLNLLFKTVNCYLIASAFVFLLLVILKFFHALFLINFFEQYGVFCLLAFVCFFCGLVSLFFMTFNEFVFSNVVLSLVIPLGYLGGTIVFRCIDDKWPDFSTFSQIIKDGFVIWVFLILFPIIIRAVADLVRRQITVRGDTSKRTS